MAKRDEPTPDERPGLERGWFGLPMRTWRVLSGMVAGVAVVIVVVGITSGGREGVPKDRIESDLLAKTRTAGATKASCGGDLDGKVGANVGCTVTGRGGATTRFRVTMTAVDGRRYRYTYAQVR